MMKKYKILVLCVASVTMMQAELSVRKKNYLFQEALNNRSQQDVINLFDNYFPINKPLSGNRQDNAQLFLEKYYPQFSGIELSNTVSLQQLVNELDKRGEAKTGTAQDKILVSQLRQQIKTLERELQSLREGKGNSGSSSSGSGSSSGAQSGFDTPKRPAKDPNPTSGSGSTSSTDDTPDQSGNNSGDLDGSSSSIPSMEIPPPPPMPGQCLPGGLGLGVPPPPPMPFSGQILQPKKVSGLEKIIADYDGVLAKFKAARALRVDEKDLRSYGILNNLIRRKDQELGDLEVKNIDNLAPFLNFVVDFADKYDAIITLTKANQKAQELQKQLHELSNEINHKVIEFEMKAEEVAQKHPNQDIEALLFPIDKELTDELNNTLKEKKISIAAMNKAIREFNAAQGERQKQLDAATQQLEKSIIEQTMLMQGNPTLSSRISALIEKLEDAIKVHLGDEPKEGGSKSQDTLGDNSNQRQLKLERDAGLGPLSVMPYTGQKSPFYIGQRIEIFDALSNVPNDEYAMVGFLKENSTAEYGIFSKLLQTTEKLAIIDGKLELWVLAPAVVDYKTDIYFERQRGKRIDIGSQRSVDDGYPKLKIVKDRRIKGQQALYCFAAEKKDYTGIPESKSSIPYIYWKLVPRIASKQKAGLCKVL